MKSRKNNATRLTRRSFLKHTLPQYAGLLLIPGLARSNAESNAKDVNSCLVNTGTFTVQHTWTDSTATLEIQGLQSTLKVLHLTDTHVTCSNETDLPFRKYSARMDEAYHKTTHYRTGTAGTPLENLRLSLQLAQREKVDFIVLTGDIVNNPSQTSVSAIVNELHKINIPYTYVAGNHDWHYEGMAGTADELRETWRKKRLSPLFHTDALSHFAVVKAGINFIAIDNSTYQVTEQQGHFFSGTDSFGPAIGLAHAHPPQPALVPGRPVRSSKLGQSNRQEL
jgi:predicted MPP superfamily phosphohydrolase